MEPGRFPDFRMTQTDRARVIALTGGIASGKTAAADAFAALGVPIIDTDLIAREVVAPGTAGLAAVIDAFGHSIRNPDGSLDRATLRRLIFADSDARKRLEAILHPLIAAAAQKQLKAVSGPYCILAVPLLVESGLFEDADRVLVVDVPESVQIERLMQRDGNNRSQAEAALAAQVSRQLRLSRADDVIDNSGSLADLHAEVARLDAFYRNLANQKRAD
jgi:dephospho-CoA kinase